MLATIDPAGIDLNSVLSSLGTGGVIAAALLYIHRDMMKRVLPRVVMTFRRDIRRDRRILLRRILAIPQQCQSSKRRPMRKPKPREPKPKPKPKRKTPPKNNGPDLAKCLSLIHI